MIKLRHSIFARVIFLYFISPVYHIYAQDIDKFYTQDIDIYRCQAIVERIEKLIPVYNLDSYTDEAAHKLFDVNSYFKILNHLKIVDGYSLDYTYCSFHRYGSPLILSRKNDEPPHNVNTACTLFESILWFPDAKEKMTTKYLEVIDLDGTPQSFFQFAVLYLLGDQFYLFDHALYDDDIVICTQEKLMKVLNSTYLFGQKIDFTDDEKEKMLKADVSPSIAINDFGDSAIVITKIISFSKWKGFQRHIFQINGKDFKGNRHYWLTDKKVEIIVPYNIGVKF